MTIRSLSANTWAEYERDARRFNRTLLLVAIPFVVLCVIIPLWELTGLQEGGGEELSDRYAELLLQQAQQEAEQPDPAPPVEEPVEEPEPEPESESVAEPEPEAEPQPEPDTVAEPKPQVDERQQAREKVRQQFQSSFDELRELRETPVVPGTSRPLEQASAADEPTASSSGVITSELGRGSGGSVAAPRRNTAPSSTGLSGRDSTAVETEIVARGGAGEDRNQAGFGGDSRLQGRTLEEIQIVMDRNKSGLYSLYNRALRQDATLQGKVVLEITIAPSGEVTRCEIVSSELRNKDLEDRIVRRVKLIDFGAKDVAEITIKYPIHFIPS